MFFPLRGVVHCEWSEWTIDTCTKTCGGGRRNKIRTALVSAANGGDPCLGSSTKDDPCNIQKCPGDSETTFIAPFGFC